MHHSTATQPPAPPCTLPPARRLQDGAQDPHQTINIGTPSTMAPEVRFLKQMLKDGCSYGPAADIYSIGATVAQALGIACPFEKDQFPDTASFSDLLVSGRASAACWQGHC
jgi:serine/threonine protein kinase